MFNKIGAPGVSLQAAVLPMALAAGATFLLPAGNGIVGTFGAIPFIGSGNVLSGQYTLQLGQYSILQVYDAQLNYWRNVSVGPQQLVSVSSDGTNFRIANTTGCPIGALITNAGSGLANGFYGFNSSAQAITIVNGTLTLGNAVFTITPSAGVSQWNSIVGGAINITIGVTGTLFQNGAFGGTGVSSVGSGGSNYTKPPIIIFTPPLNQGSQPYILPTAVCTIAAGAVNAVTVTNQGAGLLGLPQITVLPQPGDITGGGAVLGWTVGNSGQVGSGTLLAMWPLFYGTAQTAPITFVFSPASTIAATAIMNFTITGFTNTTPGVGYVGAGGTISGGIVQGAAANTNPAFDKNISIPIPPPIIVAATTGIPTLAGGFSGVNYQAVPVFSAYSAGAAPGTAAVQTPTVGGVSDLITLTSL